jgi:hypothetical protein
VQSTTQARRTADKADAGGETRPAAQRTAPTELDLAGSPAMEGISQRALSEVCRDLFGRLEASLITNRPKFIEDYFATMVKQDEMTTLWGDPAYYDHLRVVIQEDVLPLYDRYCAIRAAVLAKTEKRAWPKFCLTVIGICLGLEVLFTEGRVLRPQMLLPSVLVDGFIGLGLYYLVNFRDASTLKRARSNLLNSIREIEARSEVAKRYEVFRKYTGGELLTAEAELLLARYPTPEEFWTDYYEVRKADPTTPEELERLGKRRFRDFLELHAGGSYSQEARQQRFDALFLLAHKLFMLRDRQNYVLRNLKKT